MSTIMISVNYLVEIGDPKARVDEDVLDTIMDHISDKISDDVKVEVDGKTYELGWASTTTNTLDPETSNCGRCAKCGILVTDMEKPDPIEGLCNGATVNGQLLCDECLPIGHKWAL